MTCHRQLKSSKIDGALFRMHWLGQCTSTTANRALGPMGDTQWDIERQANDNDMDDRMFSSFALLGYRQQGLLILSLLTHRPEASHPQ